MSPIGHGLHDRATERIGRAFIELADSGTVEQIMKENGGGKDSGYSDLWFGTIVVSNRKTPGGYWLLLRATAQALEVSIAQGDDIRVIKKIHDIVGEIIEARPEKLEPNKLEVRTVYPLAAKMIGKMVKGYIGDTAADDVILRTSRGVDRTGWETDDEWWLGKQFTMPLDHAPVVLPLDIPHGDYRVILRNALAILRTGVDDIEVVASDVAGRESDWPS